VPINHTDEDVIISKCKHCGRQSDRYINCTNDDCHDQHICCEECESKTEGFCSERCRDYVEKYPARDARRRIKAKLKMYEKYNQKHYKASEFQKKMNEFKG
jgi:UPF0176 protein